VRALTFRVTLKTRIITSWAGRDSVFLALPLCLHVGKRGCRPRLCAAIRRHDAAMEAAGGQGWIRMRRSATVFAVTEIPCSTSTLMLSRQLKRCFRISSIVRAGYRSTAFSPSKQSGAHQEACYGRNSFGSLATFAAIRRASSLVRGSARQEPVIIA
jgi:hypothetical protein